MSTYSLNSRHYLLCRWKSWDYLEVVPQTLIFSIFSCFFIHVSFKYALGRRRIISPLQAFSVCMMPSLPNSSLTYVVWLFFNYFGSFFLAIFFFPSYLWIHFFSHLKLKIKIRNTCVGISMNSFKGLYYLYVSQEEHSTVL